jgi:hypothetical protein
LVLLLRLMEVRLALKGRKVGGASPSWRVAKLLPGLTSGLPHRQGGMVTKPSSSWIWALSASGLSPPGGSGRRQGHGGRAASQCQRCKAPWRGSSERGNGLGQLELPPFPTRGIDEVHPCVAGSAAPAGRRLPQVALLHHLPHLGASPARHGTTVKWEVIW